MTGRDGLRGELRYRIAACINYFSRTDEAVVRGVERSLGRYDRLREAAGVERRLIEEPAYLLPGPLAPIQAGLECALGIVPALFGGLTGGVPYVVTRGLARRLVLRSRHPPSLSLLHILIGAVAFPLFWGSVLFMVWRAGGVQAAAVLAVLLVPSGLFTLFFVRRVGKLAVHVSGRLASLMRLGETARVRQAQSELMLEMDSVRARYIREVFEPEGSGRT
jgi:hypothetical protein